MRRIDFITHRENFIGAGLSLIAFCVYLTTLSLSVGYTDSGELASVVCTLGIAHPTGYPLFTLLGRCWLMLPFLWEEILRLNLLSALFVSLTVGIFFKTTLAIYRAVEIFQQRNKKSGEMRYHQFLLASAVASLTVGFSMTIWSQAASFEVYALHLVMVLLTTWSFISGLEEQYGQPECVSRYLILFAFVLGLSFSNHMTTILLAPAFLWMYFRIFGFGRESWHRIFIIAPFFFLGLSVYLYLPIRSAVHPPLDWGHPATLERFLWHVSGKQYRVWMFSHWDVVQKQFKYFLSNFPSEFNILAIVCMVVGFIELWKQSRRLLAFLALLFLSTILYAANYDIFDIDSYFLLSYLSIGWIVVSGMNAVIHWAGKYSLKIKALVIAVLCAIPIIQVVSHWEKVHVTESDLSQQVVRKTYLDLEKNAVVLATQWDYFISPSLYYHFVRNERPDLVIIDKSLLQNRSWYFILLDRQAPWLMGRMNGSAQNFLAELYKFEHGEPFDFNTIQARWRALLADIVEKSIPDHPVYVDARIEREFPSEYQRTPVGYFLQLTKAEDTSKYWSAISAIGMLDRGNPVVKDFEQYYVLMLLRDAEWLLRHKEIEKAKQHLSEVLRIAPDNQLANWMLKQLVR